MGRLVLPLALLSIFSLNLLIIGNNLGGSMVRKGTGLTSSPFGNLSLTPWRTSISHDLTLRQPYRPAISKNPNRRNKGANDVTVLPPFEEQGMTGRREYATITSY